MHTLWDVLDGLTSLVDMLTHPRFFVPLLCGIVLATAAWRSMPTGDPREVVALGLLLAGLVVGVIWDWGR